MHPMLPTCVMPKQFGSLRLLNESWWVGRVFLTRICRGNNLREFQQKVGRHVEDVHSYWLGLIFHFFETLFFTLVCVVWIFAIAGFYAYRFLPLHQRGFLHQWGGEHLHHRISPGIGARVFSLALERMRFFWLFAKWWDCFFWQPHILTLLVWMFGSHTSYELVLGALFGIGSFNFRLCETCELPLLDCLIIDLTTVRRRSVFIVPAL